MNHQFRFIVDELLVSWLKIYLTNKVWCIKSKKFYLINKINKHFILSKSTVTKERWDKYSPLEITWEYSFQNFQIRFRFCANRCKYSEAWSETLIYDTRKSDTVIQREQVRNKKNNFYLFTLLRFSYLFPYFE